MYCNRSDMTDEEADTVRYSNDNQGFYIYRETDLFSVAVGHIECIRKFPKICCG